MDLLKHETEILEVFSYLDVEQKVFDYISAYMSLIYQDLDQIRGDSERLRRYMLAGLFLTYRMCSHSGWDMHTGSLAVWPEGIDRTRMEKFREISGEDLKGIKDYKERIGMNAFTYLFKEPAKMLHKFVMG